MIEIKEQTIQKLQKITNNLVNDFNFDLNNSAIYFHQKAIECCNNEDFLTDKHLEYIYATLATWGMDSQSAKLPPFGVFKKSIIDNKKDINDLRKDRIEKLSADEIETILPKLNDLCFKDKGIKATMGKSKIVSGSKTLAHILPNLICPIDNRYTLTYFKDDTKNLGYEKKFQYIIKSMWKFYQMAEKSKIMIGAPFSLSYPKYFDNLIMYYGGKKRK